MAKWGTEVRWGTDHLWGAETYPYPTIFWTVQIDWNGDGVVEGNDALGRIVGFKSSRGREFLFNSSGNGFQPVNAGQVTITLDNSDGKYDPYNTLSPIYPNVVPGRLIEVKVSDHLNEIYPVFTGYIEDIRPGGAGNQEVVITAVDAMEDLKNRKVTIALQSSITVKDAIEDLLEAAGINNHAIDNFSDTIGYWWVDQQSASEAMQELVDASLSTFFIAANGTAKCYTRNRIAGSVLSLDDSVLLKDMQLRQPWEVIKNNIDVIINPRIVNTTGTLWQLQDKPMVPAGGSLEIWADYRALGQSVPAMNVIDPAATTDYTMNTLQNGTGTNLTASFSVAITKYSQSAKLVVTNGSASDGYVTSLKIRGDAITAPDPVRLNRQDAASQAVYKVKSFVLNSKWLQETLIGVDIADLLKILLPNPRKYPIIRVQNRPEFQYSMDLFDRIGLRIPSKMIDDAFVVGKIEIEWLTPTGLDVITTIHLEPVISSSENFWVFPADVGVSTYFGA